MALGDSRQTSSKKVYDNTYYSRVGFVDPDKLKLGFNYKSGMLIVGISKPKDGNEAEYEVVAEIYITCTKANMLLAKIKDFEEFVAAGTADTSVGFGINSGLGEVSSVLILHVDKNNNKCVTIGKVNPDGSYKTKVTYEFNVDYHYALNWSNIDSMKCEKDFVSDVEYNMFVGTIKSFAENMNGAIAYSVADLARYDTRSILNRMNPIYDKLGIERMNSGSSGRSENNFFARTGNTGTSNHKSSLEEAFDLGEYEED